MKRKIVLHGPSTLTVSLPASWAKKFSIKKGDELEVDEIGNELRVSASNELIAGFKEINIGDRKRFGKSCITSSYRRGFDEIHLNYDSNDYIKTVKDLVTSELTGFEIIKHGNKCCVIKDLTGHSKDEFDNALRRTWLLILDMANEAYISIRKGEFENLENIMLMDESVNKFSNYCLRILGKRGHSDFSKTHLYFHLIKSLEKIADSYKGLCSHHQDVDDKSLEMFNELNKCLENFYSAFYDYHPEKIESLFSMTKGLQNKLVKLQSSQGFYLTSICNDIRDLLSLLVEINL